MRVTTLPVKKLVVADSNIRSRLFEGSLKDLALSLKLHGQLYPLLVTVNGDEFHVLDGQRRLLAMRALGWEEATVGVLDGEDADGLQVAYAGNFQREGISYIDEAEWLGRVVQSTGLSVDRLAGGLARSESYVRSRLGVLEWPSVLLDYISGNEVSFSVAREYARLGEGRELENAIIFDRSANPSYRQAAAYVASLLAARETVAPVQDDVPKVSGYEGAGELRCVMCGGSVAGGKGRYVYVGDDCIPREYFGK